MEGPETKFFAIRERYTKYLIHNLSGRPNTRYSCFPEIIYLHSTGGYVIWQCVTEFFVYSTYVKTMLEMANRARQPRGTFSKHLWTQPIGGVQSIITTSSPEVRGRVVDYFGLRLLASCDSSRCSECQRQEILHLIYHCLFLKRAWS